MGKTETNPSKFTPLEITVLRATKDSVRLETTGIDKYPGANRHWKHACLRLAARGLLEWHPTQITWIDAWSLTAAGVEAMKALDEETK